MRSLAMALLLLGTMPELSVCQERGDVYVRRESGTVKGILFDFANGSNSCGTIGLAISGSATLVFISVVDANNLLVGLSENALGDDFAVKDKYYCISKAKFDFYFQPKRGPEIGIVTVPFKLRFSPIKVMAGNTIGPFVGARLGKSKDSYATLLGFAGLSNVPLNDLNNEVPQTRWGVGIGGGLVWTVQRSFQIGAISGVDLFEGVEDWPYRFQPWVSLSIGYAFTNTNKNADVAARAPR